MAIDYNDPWLQEYVQQQQKNRKKVKTANDAGEQPPATEDKPQRGPFRKKRAGVTLSRQEVKAIRQGRRRLRKELRKMGIRSRREFELTAGTLGLYFDGRHSFWMWLWSHWLGALIGALAVLLAVLFIFSLVTQARGFFTINLSDGLFREGFVMADNVAFRNATTQLFATPAEDLTCISITQIPDDIDSIDGVHNGHYFAYTFYLRNEGESTVGFEWDVKLNAETQDLADAAWMLLFTDGQMKIYAQADRDTGLPAALPAFGDNSRGYVDIPIMKLAPDSDQFEEVARSGDLTYWRVIPEPFATDTVLASGAQGDVEPGAYHKFTVVLYLEGDDPEADDSKIGAHMGVEMNFRLVGEESDTDKTSDSLWSKIWDSLFGGLKFD